jgi:tetratricopeptide (TPR) repeat protein
MRRAQQTQHSRDQAESKPQGGAELLRQAQEMLREQQFARAHELMLKACEADPDNELYKLYRMWAAFRANALDASELSAFKSVLREKLNDDLLKAFAFYAMGHVLLGDKKDEQAERFFAKAVELDKNNKDAERHLRLIELRRKKAAVDKGNKIFGIEIGTKKS